MGVFDIKKRQSYWISITFLLFLIIGLTVIVPANATPGWKFRGDLNNTGVYDDGGIRPTHTLKWKFSTGSYVNPGPFVESSPSVVNGVVYIGNSYGSYFGTAGNVFAIDANTGSEMWRFATGGDVTSGPAVVNDVVYIGSQNGKVYAIDAKTGTQVWSFSTGCYGSISPAVTNDRVYFGSGGNSCTGKFYSLDATTGTQIWSIQDTTTQGFVGSSPAIANGIVYFGDAMGYVYAVDTNTGTQIWKVLPMGTANTINVISSPAVANGVVYFGSNNGKVYAINANTGIEIWNYSTDSYVRSSPAVANGVVYIGSMDGKLYALDVNTGTQIWSFVAANNNNGVVSSPAIANGIVYFGDWDSNKIYALDASKGVHIWNYTTGGSISSSPTITNGVLYVGSNDGTVYALGDTSAYVTDFSGSPTSGTAPVTVLFTDSSTNNPISWQWSFGDGDSTNSTKRNPIHTYNHAGIYSISLTVINATGSHTKTKTNYITTSEILPKNRWLNVSVKGYHQKYNVIADPDDRSKAKLKLSESSLGFVDATFVKVTIESDDSKIKVEDNAVKGWANFYIPSGNYTITCSDNLNSLHTEKITHKNDEIKKIELANLLLTDHVFYVRDKETGLQQSNFTLSLWKSDKITKNCICPTNFPLFLPRNEYFVSKEGYKPEIKIIISPVSWSGDIDLIKSKESHFSDFSPFVDGFSFPNSQKTTPVFGSKQANCYGFSSVAILNYWWYNKDQQPENRLHYFNPTSEYPNRIPISPDSALFSNEKIMNAYLIDDVEFKIILHQANQEDSTHDKLDTEYILSTIKRGSPILLKIAPTWNCWKDSHEIVVFGYVIDLQNKIHLAIYDSNAPNKINWAEWDPAINTFFYDNGEKPSPYNNLCEAQLPKNIPYNWWDPRTIFSNDLSYQVKQNMLGYQILSSDHPIQIIDLNSKKKASFNNERFESDIPYTAGFMEYSKDPLNNKMNTVYFIASLSKNLDVSTATPPGSLDPLTVINVENSLITQIRVESEQPVTVRTFANSTVLINSTQNTPFSITLSSSNSTLDYVNIGTFNGTLSSTSNIILNTDRVNTMNVDVNGDGLTIVASVAPVVLLTPSTMQANVGEIIQFNSSGTCDPATIITNYSWDFADGSIGTGQSVSHSYTNPGNYSVSVQVVDGNGNLGIQSKTIHIITTPENSASINSYWGSDSDNNPSTNTVTNSQNSKTAMLAPLGVSTGPWTTQSINGPTHITQIELQPIGTFKDLFLLTEKPDSLPKDIPSPTAPVYELHKIDLYHATSNDINQAVIEFTVSPSYLDSQKMTYRDVQLLRYHNNAWEYLPTEYVGMKDGEHLYKARTTGFSYFATVLVKDATTLPATIVPTLAAQQQVSATPGVLSTRGTITPTAAKTQAVPSVIDTPKSAGFPITMIVFGIAALIILGAGGFIVRKWWIRKQNPTLFQEEPFFGRRK